MTQLSQLATHGPELVLWPLLLGTFEPGVFCVLRREKNQTLMNRSKVFHYLPRHWVLRVNKPVILYFSLTELSVHSDMLLGNNRVGKEPGFCPDNARNEIKEIAFRKDKVMWESRKG